MKYYKIVNVVTIILFGIFLSIFLVLSAYADITGKISGRVIDKVRKTPLPGVYVQIKGTTMNNYSEADGSYFIINVPVGIYDVAAMFIDYGIMEVKGVKVAADKTTELDFELTARGIHLEYEYEDAFKTTISDSIKITFSERRLALSNNRFAFELLKEITREEGKNKNIVISPFSISMALAMVYNGSDGETKKAIERTLELSDLKIEEVNNSYKKLSTVISKGDPEVEFNIGNSIWIRDDFRVKKDFIDLNKNYFDALVKTLNFNHPQAAQKINGWVDRKTKGRIKEIVVSPIDPLIMMYIINATYFKGMWADKFDKEFTQDDWFVLPDSSKRPCRMMNKTDCFRYLERSGFQIIELPYGNGPFSMVIFLPNPKEDIDSLIKAFDFENWNKLLDNLYSKLYKDCVKLHLPKFTLEYDRTLKHILNSLGMGIAFTPQANFTKINDEDPLHISQVRHRTFIKVGEEGTEAAAVTLIDMEIACMPPKPFIMRVDRPFLFVIRENESGSIFFMGRIVEPIIK